MQKGERQGVKKKNGRVLRPGRGKAFLRFLVGEMVLLLVCVCVYLFVLQGTIELPGVEKMLKDNVNLGDLNVNLPSYQTVTPSPEPTATPVPEARLSARAELAALGDLSQADDSWLKANLFSFTQSASGGQYALSVSGHAYLEGMDARSSTTYLLARNTGSGAFEAAWQAERAKGAWELSFDSANGVHLDEAYYSACVDAGGLTPGAYRLYVCVRNGERTGLAPLDEQAENFRIDAAQAE